MKILTIETTCDETAAAVVTDELVVLRDADPSAPLGVQLGAVETVGGALPMVTWLDGSTMAVCTFDPESLTWSTPEEVPLPPVW